jgi:hypothetical protein
MLYGFASPGTTTSTGRLEHKGAVMTQSGEAESAREPGLAETNTNGHGGGAKAPAEAPSRPQLPGDVRRAILSRDTPDPIWYVGRTGPSVQDVLDAQGDDLAKLRALVREPANNGNGQPKTRRRRHPA